MSTRDRESDLERLDKYQDYSDLSQSTVHETESLLPGSKFVKHEQDDSAEFLSTKPRSKTTAKRVNYAHISLAFLGGVLACFLVQFLVCRGKCFPSNSSATRTTTNAELGANVAPPYVGSSEVHNFPPTKPTNAFPSLFPSNLGYPGFTTTGAEPAMIITAPAYPTQSGAAALLVPSAEKLKHHSGGKEAEKHGGKSDGHFDLFRHWGNLSPWYSVGRNAFGVDSSPEPPERCTIKGLHLLHRHGARYPTTYASYGGPSALAKRLHTTASKWNASRELSFLNGWTYKLGEELLTPFGRQQLYDLGVTMRLKYGFLLKDFTTSNTIPVFRTESQDRMYKSAVNFALGFFGYPLEGKYQQSVTIEANGFNNTLAPYSTCPNAQIGSKADRGTEHQRRWAEIYLQPALKRLKPLIPGFELTIEDVYRFQQMCAYETVAIGFSEFCGLFTIEEWEAFDYALDLGFWYNNAFGSPVARVQGIGYVQELVARLTHTPIAVHNSSTNSTLNDNPITFPLRQSLYVDATHEVVVLNIITALNLTTFAEMGPLPADHIPEKRTFRSSQLAPFATNVQFQLLSCSDKAEEQIRVIINDGVVPLTGVRGCPEEKDGMCSVPVFVDAQREIIGNTDWEWDCRGDWEVPGGTNWNTTTGDPPRKGGLKA